MAHAVAQRYRFIVVEGPIGVGKTTLARHLADSLQGELILENAANNPFLEQFYTDPKRNALPAQLHFLLERVKQLSDIRQSNLFHAIRISDYLLEKDRIFAQLTLNAREFELYQQIYERLHRQSLQPDLVIYLQAPVAVLMERIQKRGVKYEQWITHTYLQQLVSAYTEYFHYYDDSPLLIVNAAEVDFAQHKKDYAQLLSQIEQARPGRQYFNPLPLQ